MRTFNRTTILQIAMLCIAVNAAEVVPAKLQLGKADSMQRWDNAYGSVPAYERGQAIVADLLLPATAPAAGKVQVSLTDSYGRILLSLTKDGSVKDGRIAIEITPDNVCAMVHMLSVQYSAKDKIYHGHAGLVLRPPAEWDDYVVMNWHRPKVDQIPANWEVGIRGTTWQGRIPAPPHDLIRNNFRYYVEGIGNSIFAAYHLWRPEQNLSVYYYMDKDNYKQDRTDLLAWQRNPSLANPWIHERIFKWFHNAVRVNRASRPYFYSIADEPGIADQAAPSDYDFSPWAREAFRDWLDRKYGDAGTVPVVEADIYDWAGLLKALQHKSAKHIFDALPAPLKKQVKTGSVTTEVKKELVTALNTQFKSPDFFNPKHWRKSQLCEEAQNLRRKGIKKLEPAELMRFNRLALQARFPHLISRSVEVLRRVNAEWGTDYTDWRKLRALTTDETFARKGDNFSPWCDHKDFMDDQLIMVGYGRASRAIKSTDATARLGGGGFQGPTAVGGWDYWKLVQTLDVIEDYPIGNNYELIRSFNPNTIDVNMCGDYSPGSEQSLWFRMIHGSRSSVIWDHIKGERIVGADKKPTKRGRALGKVFAEIKAGIAKQVIASKRADDPIAIYESQPSLRVHWCLDVRPLGKRWINRGSWSERQNCTTYRMRASCITAVEDNGYQYVLLSDQQVKRGDLKVYDPLTGAGFKLLIMPRILSMSKAEVASVRAFVKAGGTVVAAGRPALFDDHGRRLPAGQLDDLFGADTPAKDVLLVCTKDGVTRHNVKIIDYHRQRLVVGKENAVKDAVMLILNRAIGSDRHSPYVLAADGKPFTGVEVTTWKNGKATFSAIHYNRQYFISDMAGGEIDFKTNKRYDVPVKLSAKLKAHLYNVREGKAIGDVNEYTFTLDPYRPTIICATPVAVARFTAGVGPHVPGKALQVEIKPGANSPFATAAYHVAVIDPAGKANSLHTQNVIAKDGQPVVAEIPFAANEMAGNWVITVREVLTGARQKLSVTVK